MKRKLLYAAITLTAVSFAQESNALGPASLGRNFGQSAVAVDLRSPDTATEVGFIRPIRPTLSFNAAPVTTTDPDGRMIAPTSRFFSGAIGQIVQIVTEAFFKQQPTIGTRI